MKEIQRISITDSVVNNIREMIESGEYSIGQKLPTEAKLCEMFGVSRTCVREATRVLQAIGYVNILPGKGAFVADYKENSNLYQNYERIAGNKNTNKNWYDVEGARFYDFMEVRQAIETLSVRLSVERATPAQVQELENIHQQFVLAIMNQDMVQMILLDELFHTKIISYTRNKLLININRQLVDCFKKYRGDSFTNREVYMNALQPHSNILFCFQQKNAAQAVIEMKKHLDITTRDMERIHKMNSKDSSDNSDSQQETG